MPKLHCLSGVLRGKIIELGEHRISVGRGLDNVIHLEDGTVSQHHAEVYVEDETVRVRDLTSTNGTRVNGQRIAETMLNNGDRLYFGAVEMLFECGAGQAGGPTPAPRDCDLPQAGSGNRSPAAVPDDQLLGAPRHVGLPMAFHSRLHALSEAQVVPDSGRCVQCGICSYNCPAGIDVRAHAWRGRPIFDSHCLTCSECVNRCPRGVLRFEQLPLFSGAL